MTGLMSKLTHCLPGGKHKHDDVDGFVNEEDDQAVHPHGPPNPALAAAHKDDGNVISHPADGTTLAAAAVKDKTAAPYTAQPGDVNADHKHGTAATTTSHAAASHPPAPLKPEFAAGMGQTTVATPAAGVTPGTGVAPGHAAAFAPIVAGPDAVKPKYAAEKPSSGFTTGANPTPTNIAGTVTHSTAPAHVSPSVAKPVVYGSTPVGSTPTSDVVGGSRAAPSGSVASTTRPDYTATSDDTASTAFIPGPAAGAGISAGMLGGAQSHAASPLSVKQSRAETEFAPSSNTAARDSEPSEFARALDPLTTTGGGAAGAPGSSLQGVKEAVVAGVAKAQENVAWGVEKAKENVAWGVEQAKATTGIGATTGTAASPVATDAGQQHNRALDHNPVLDNSAAAPKAPLLPTHVGLVEDREAPVYAKTDFAAGGVDPAGDKPVTQKVKENAALVVDKVKAAVGVKGTSSGAPAATTSLATGGQAFPTGETDAVVGTAGGAAAFNNATSPAAAHTSAAAGSAPYDAEASGFARALDPIATETNTTPVVQRVKENAAWAAQKVQDNVAWAVGKGKPADGTSLAPEHLPVDAHAEEYAGGGLTGTRTLVPDSEADVVAARDGDSAAATTSGTAGNVVQRVKDNAAWAAQKVQENAAWAVGKGGNKVSTTPADEPVEVQQAADGGLESWLPPVDKQTGVHSVTPVPADTFVGDESTVDGAPHTPGGTPMVETAKQNAVWAAQKVKENAAWVAGKAKGMVYPGTAAAGQEAGVDDTHAHAHGGLGGGHVSKEAMEAVAQEMSAEGRRAGITAQPGL